MDACKGSIYDKVIDGKEYQLIKRKSLILNLQKSGASLSIPEQVEFKGILRPIIQDYIDIKIIQDFLSDLGIKEDLPVKTKHMDFSTLEPEDIRIFNKIIQYMEVNQIDGVANFLKEENIDTIKCIGKSKEEVIQIIEDNKFREVLRDKGILHYGEEMSETLTQFLEITKE